MKSSSAGEPRISSSQRISISVPLDLDIEASDLEARIPLPSVPLFSAWFIKALRNETTKVADVQLTCDTYCPIGSIGRKTSAKLAFFWVSSSGARRRIALNTYQSLTVAPEQWNTVCLSVTDEALSRAEEKSNSVFVAKTHRAYLLKVVCEGQPSSAAAVTQGSLDAARRLINVIGNPSPLDVVFTFPRTPELRLYTHKALLTASSPYFKTLFASGFSEATPVEPPAKRARQDRASPPAAGAKGDNDSDDKLDARYLAAGAGGSPDPSDPVHEIKITEGTYTAYRALLLYLSSGFIDFSPLSSACLPALSGAPCTRARSTRARLNQLGLPLLLPSPKSIYRLAHLYQLDALRTHALSVFVASLEPTTAALELVTSFAVAYDEIRAAVVEFIVSHFYAVEGSEAYKEVMAKVKGGEMPLAAGAMAELVKALRKSHVRANGDPDSDGDGASSYDAADWRSDSSDSDASMSEDEESD
ncbi:hypothetical protein JCM10213_002582 [Rhodosporidiobolus nylandii]